MTEETRPLAPPNAVRIGDFWAYVLPMAIFMGFTYVGGTWMSVYPLSYTLKTCMVAAALWLLRSRYTKVRWNHWWLGLIVGILGTFQWVGMQLYLQQFDFFKPEPEVFDPTSWFAGQPRMLVGFIGIRVAGAALVVPVMEELFWRDFLWRSIAAADFKQAQVGAWGWLPFIGVALAFGSAHGNEWLTAIVWAMLLGLLLVRTKSLGACMIAHAVTNLMLAGYVLYTRQWFFW